MNVADLPDWPIQEHGLFMFIHHSSILAQKHKTDQNGSIQRAQYKGHCMGDHMHSTTRALKNKYLMLGKITATLHHTIMYVCKHASYACMQLHACMHCTYLAATFRNCDLANLGTQLDFASDTRSQSSAGEGETGRHELGGGGCSQNPGFMLPK